MTFSKFTILTTLVATLMAAEPIMDVGNNKINGFNGVNRFGNDFGTFGPFGLSDDRFVRRQAISDNNPTLNQDQRISNKPFLNGPIGRAATILNNAGGVGEGVGEGSTLSRRQTISDNNPTVNQDQRISNKPFLNGAVGRAATVMNNAGGVDEGSTLSRRQTINDIETIEEIERVERVERPEEIAFRERFDRPTGFLVGDDAFDRQHIIAEDPLNRAEVDRFRFDGDHWHPHRDFHDNGPVIINQESTII